MVAKTTEKTAVPDYWPPSISVHVQSVPKKWLIAAIVVGGILSVCAVFVCLDLSRIRVAQEQAHVLTTYQKERIEHERQERQRDAGEEGREHEPSDVSGERQLPGNPR